MFRGDAGTTQTPADLFAALSANPALTTLAEGTFDETNNTLTATSVKVVDEIQDGSGRRGGGDRFRRGSDRGNWSNGTLSQ